MTKKIKKEVYPNFLHDVITLQRRLESEAERLKNLIIEMRDTYGLKQKVKRYLDDKNKD